MADNEPIKVVVIERTKTIRQLLSEWSPIAISVLALFFAGYEGFKSRQHDRLSVRPMGLIHTYATGIDEYDGIAIQNEGLGPGLLQNLRVYYRGKIIYDEHTNNWESIVDANRTMFHDGPIVWTSSSYQSTIPTNSTFWILRTKPDNITNMTVFDRDFVSQITVAFELCSLYEECVPQCAGPYCSALK